MASDTTELPGEWVADDPDYDFQKQLWTNGKNGDRLVLESRQEPWHDEDEDPDLQLVLLPPDPEVDTPVTTVIEQTKDLDEAVEEARDFMQKEADRW